MILAAVRHPVIDYDKWKSVYDTYPPTSHGAKFARINRSVDDPNVVMVVIGFDTVEEAQAFNDDPTLKAKMADAGVTSAPRIELYEEVEVT